MKYLNKSFKILGVITFGLLVSNCSSDSGGSDPVVHLRLFRRQNTLLLYPLEAVEQYLLRVDHMSKDKQ